MFKISKSLALLAISVTAVVGGTYAYFSDTAVVSGSTIETGTLDLKVDKDTKPGTQDWSDGFESPIKLKDLAPGFSKSQIVDIQKAGSIDGQASVRLSLTSNKDGLTHETWGGSLAQNMRVKIRYAADNATFVDTGLDFTLAEYHANSNQLLLGDIIGENKVASIEFTYYIPASAGNDIQGDSVSINTVFGLEQKL